MTNVNPSAPASVRWLSDDGSTRIPSGLRLVTIARWDDDGADWMDKPTWSVVVEFPHSPLELENPCSGRIGFLVPDAPQERLRAGRKCVLYDGLRQIAEVTILEDA